jgi:hypothetical protein
MLATLKRVYAPLLYSLQQSFAQDANLNYVVISYCPLLKKSTKILSEISLYFLKIGLFKLENKFAEVGIIYFLEFLNPLQESLLSI